MFQAQALTTPRDMGEINYYLYPQGVDSLENHLQASFYE